MLSHYGFVFTPIGPGRIITALSGPIWVILQRIERDLEASNPDLLWWFRHGPLAPALIGLPAGINGEDPAKAAAQGSARLTVTPDA